VSFFNRRPSPPGYEHPMDLLLVELGFTYFRIAHQKETRMAMHSVQL